MQFRCWHTSNMGVHVHWVDPAIRSFPIQFVMLPEKYFRLPKCGIFSLFPRSKYIYDASMCLVRREDATPARTLTQRATRPICVEYKSRAALKSALKIVLKFCAQILCWKFALKLFQTASVSLTVADHFRPQINKLDWHVTSHLWLIQASHVNQAYLSEVPSGQLTDWGWPMLSGIISAQIFSTKFEHKIWARIFSGASAQTKILNVQISTVTI